MPYKTISDLPDSTKNLPAGAKRIFLAAFNSASEQYKDADRGEARAFATAWAAVKRKYRQAKDDKWVAKSILVDYGVFK